MRTSPEIDLIGAALAKAQAIIKPAIKNAKNPHYKSEFANEEAVHEAAKVALASHDIAVIQGAEFKDGHWVMVTRLVHKGQWIESDFPMLATQQNPQAMGSASSYARRYSYLGMVGVVAGDDDDAEVAEGRSQAPNKPQDVPDMLNPGDHVVKWGKLKGKALKQCTVVEIEKALQWAIDKDFAPDFQEIAIAYLDSQKKTTEVLPEMDYNETLPF